MLSETLRTETANSTASPVPAHPTTQPVVHQALSCTTLFHLNHLTSFPTKAKELLSPSPSPLCPSPLPSPPLPPSPLPPSLPPSLPLSPTPSLLFSLPLSPSPFSLSGCYKQLKPILRVSVLHPRPVNAPWSTEQQELTPNLKFITEVSFRTPHPLDQSRLESLRTTKPRAQL